MKNVKRSLVCRIGGIFLSGIIGLMSFSAVAVKADSYDNNQAKNSTSVSESEKKSEQYYRTRTGKCYHKGNCPCLKKSKVEVGKEEIKDKNLKQCSKCFKQVK